MVSGVFSNFSRDEIKKLIETNGGKVSSSISSKTTFLVAGSNMGPSKKEKAEKLNIKIISETDARKLKPDYFLVTPWAFIKEFIKRENSWLKDGGKFIVPFPKLKVIKYNG